MLPSSAPRSSMHKEQCEIMITQRVSFSAHMETHLSAYTLRAFQM
jgi:hypothetical protein